MRYTISSGLLLAMMVLLIGCNDSEHSSDMPPLSQTTSMILDVDWPSRTSSRMVPLAANSIAAIVRDEHGNQIADMLLNRPAEEMTFNSLPVGKITVEMSAHPQCDGKGTIQASGTMLVTTQADQTMHLTISMDSAISELLAMPQQVSLVQGQKQSLVAVAKDTMGRIVLITPGTLHWSSGDDTVACADVQTGMVTGISPGTTQVTVQESESGQKATAVITTLTPDNSIYSSDKVVRVLYMVPADCQLREGYRQWIEASMLDLQRWYYNMTGGYTFRLHDPIVETVTSTHPAAWYIDNPSSSEQWSWFFYNTFADAQETYGVQYADGKNIWVVYVDGVGPNGAAGADWFAAIPENDTQYPL